MKIFHDKSPRKYGSGPGSNLQTLDLCLLGEIWFVGSRILQAEYFYVLYSSSCKHVFSIGVENRVDPDQMASLNQQDQQ